MSRRRALPRLGGQGAAARGKAAPQAEPNRGWEQGVGVVVVIKCQGRPGEDCGHVLAHAHFVRLLGPAGQPEVRLHLLDGVEEDGGRLTPLAPSCPHCGSALAPISLDAATAIAANLVATSKTRREMYWQKLARVQ